MLLGPRVEHFANFVKLIIAITFKMLRILTENIDSICCLESEIFLGSTCSFRVLNIFVVIAITRISKVAKCPTLLGPHFLPRPLYCTRLHLCYPGLFYVTVKSLGVFTNGFFRQFRIIRTHCLSIKGTPPN